MQGVHPTAKAMPRGNAPAGPGLTRDKSGRSSRYSQVSRVRSAYRIMNRPKASTTPPATRWPVADFSALLSALAVNPNSTVKTTVNPRMNATTGNKGRLSGSGAARSPVTKDR